MARQYEDTQTRRRQIAQAALRTIAEDGASGFTTRAVAARVGISDGTLFRHFGSKDDIVAEALRLLEIEIDAGLVVTSTPMGDVEAFFRHRSAFVGAEGSVGRLIFADGLIHLAGDDGRTQIAQWRKRSVMFLVERLKKLKAQGQLHPGLDAQGASLLIQGVLLTFAMSASLGQPGSAQTLQPRIDHAWQQLSTVLFA